MPNLEPREGAITPHLDRYQGRREALLTALLEVAAIARDRGDDTSAQSLDAAGRRLAEERFTLVVLGEFKRGKSTLINALLGADVMPVGVVPLTAVPVQVVYGKQPECEINFRDGRSLRTTPERLAEFATERGNAANHKLVETIVLRHDADLLRQGVILVDTPGVGLVQQHSTEAAYRFLPHADAAVFVLSVDTPGSESEIRFLRDVKAHVTKLFFVVNKADLVSDTELAEARNFITRVLQTEARLADTQFHVVSAQARDEGFRNFYAALERFLVEEKGMFVLRRAADRARAAVDLQLNSIRVEERSLTLSEQELNSRLGEFKARLGEISRMHVEAESHLSADVRVIIARRLDPAIDALRKSGIERVSAALKREAKVSRGDLSGRLESVIRAELHDFFRQSLQGLERDLGEAMSEVGRTYAAQADRLMALVVELSAGVFELETSRIILGTQLERPSHFDFRLENQHMALELVALGVRGLVPGALGRALAFRRALRQAQEMVDRHCGRLRHDFVERMHEQEREIRHRLISGISTAESAVLRAAELAGEAHRRGAAAADAERQRIARTRARLDALRSIVDQE